jgi:hypothetical protein
MKMTNKVRITVTAIPIAMPIFAPLFMPVEPSVEGSEAGLVGAEGSPADVDAMIWERAMVVNNAGDNLVSVIEEVGSEEWKCGLDVTIAETVLV